MAEQAARSYLQEHGVEAKIAAAVTSVLKAKPAAPLAFISSALAGAPTPAKTAAAGDMFPMDAVVHQGFAGNTPDAPKPMSAFLKGVSALVVSLPGAFTPT